MTDPDGESYISIHAPRTGSDAFSHPRQLAFQ